ncbi:hypothetical protein D3C76_1043740 [compost metagenome]
MRALQAAIVQGRAGIAEGIGGGGELAVVVEAAAAQHLARHLGVAEVFDAQLVEVVAATVDRQVAAPPAFVALESDAAAVVDPADLVRAAAQRCFEAGAIGKVAVLPPVLGQYRQGRQVQGQRAVLVAFEVEDDLPRVLYRDLINIGELSAVPEIARTHEQLEGVAHILGADRLAIGKACSRVKIEAQPVPVGIAFKLLRHQPIHRVGLVLRAHGQRRVQPAIDLGNADALVDIGNEVVELADLDGRAAQRSAFRRVGIGVSEVLEAGRVTRRFTVDGQGVNGCWRGGA